MDPTDQMFSNTHCTLPANQNSLRASQIRRVECRQRQSKNHNQRRHKCSANEFDNIRGRILSILAKETDERQFPLKDRVAPPEFGSEISTLILRVFADF